MLVIFSFYYVCIIFFLELIYSVDIVNEEPDLIGYSAINLIINIIIVIIIIYLELLNTCVDLF